MTIHSLKALVEAVGILEKCDFLGDLQLNDGTIIQKGHDSLRVTFRGQPISATAYGWAKTVNIYPETESQSKRIKALWNKIRK